MTRDDLAGMVAGVAALADPIRRPLPLRERPTRADQFETKPPTRLVSLVTLRSSTSTSSPRKACSTSASSGSPSVEAPAPLASKLYARSGRQLSVILPERRYEPRGTALASAIHCGRAGHYACRRPKAATGWGRSLADQARAAAGPRPSRERLLGCTCQALAENGYEPQRTDSAVVLRKCPSMRWHENTLSWSAA